MEQVEYRLEDLESIWQKVFFIVACLLLGLLIPTTALGYFAEKSIPGQPLYIFKRGIESAVLALESVTPYGKSSYLLSLADARVQETTQLVEQAKENGSYENSLLYSDTILVDMVSSVEEAKVSIEKISDPVKKNEEKQKLVQSIQKYQNNLQTIASTINQSSTTNVILQKSSLQTAQTQQEGISPTPEDNKNQLPATQDQLLQSIQTTQQDLSVIQEQLSITPEPIILPSPTSFPVQSTFSTPTTVQEHHGDGRDRANRDINGQNDH